MEVTKWLKPLVKRVTKYGDSASVQAVTRVNVEQASKRTLHRPTRRTFAESRRTGAYDSEQSFQQLNFGF
jgi:hypothetical protein